MLARAPGRGRPRAPARPGRAVRHPLPRPGRPRVARRPRPARRRHHRRRASAARLRASGCKGPMPLTELATSVAVVGSRAASVYGVGDDAGDLRAPGARRCAGGVRRRAGHRLRGARRRASPADGRDGRRPGVRRGPGLSRAEPACCSSTSRPSSPSCPSSRPGSAPTRPRFLARNRLIAALTRGTVLVEAALRSGALNTAGWAESLHRHVMCVPGPVTSYTSQGVNNFLREGRGTVVTHGAEVLELVGAAGSTSSSHRAARRGRATGSPRPSRRSWSGCR